MHFTRRLSEVLLTSIIVLTLVFSFSVFLHGQKAHADTQTLQELAKARGIAFGAAANSYVLPDDTAYQDTLAREFNLMVLQNELKFDFTEPENNKFDYTQADILINFAQQHNMIIRGHTLVWYTALPGWVTNGNFTRDELINILHNHITNVVGHYKDTIKTWDVVNEVFADGSTSDPDGLRDDSIWYKGIGPEYVDMAFKWAHEANPDAKLFLNEYGGEGLSAKSEHVYNYVKGMLARGVPINGVGLQMHLGYFKYAPSESDLQANMQRLGDLGLEVQVTELDVLYHYFDGSKDEQLKRQAQAFADVTTACVSVSACKAIITWGVDDAHSWEQDIPEQKGEEPLLFDANYQPKATYYAVANALTSGTPPSPGDGSTVDDSLQGTGTNQFNYSGSWQHCTNCGSELYNQSDSWSTVTDDTVTITFSGTQIQFYGVQASWHGIGAISVDSGDETMIDFYNANRSGNVLLWTSSTLSSGTHTLKLRVTGQKNASSGGNGVVVDRINILA